MSRLLEAYQEELLSLEELRRRMPDLRKKESGMRSQLDALESRLLNEESYLKLAEDLQSFIGRLQNAAEASTTGERQKILRLVVKEVMVGTERVVIRHSIPSSRPDPPGYPLRGRTRFAAAGEHRPVGPGRALRQGMGGVRRFQRPVLPA